MFKGFIPLCLATSAAVILWFIECFYFILNDKEYGAAGLGLFLLIVIQATIIIAGTIFAYYILEEREKTDV